MPTARFLPAVAFALAAVAPVQAQAPASGAEVENFPTLSCIDFLQAARVAVPPKNATTQQRRRAQTAQDAISAAMVWTHGYLAGRNAPGLGKMSREWLEQTVAKLARECQAAPDPGQMLLVDAVVKS